MARAAVPPGMAMGLGMVADPFRVDERVTAWLKAGRSNGEIDDSPAAAVPLVVVVQHLQLQLQLPLTSATGAAERNVMPPGDDQHHHHAAVAAETGAVDAAAPLVPAVGPAAAAAAGPAVPAEEEWRVNPLLRGPNEEFERRSLHLALPWLLVLMAVVLCATPLAVGVSVPRNERDDRALDPAILLVSGMGGVVLIISALLMACMPKPSHASEADRRRAVVAGFAALHTLLTLMWLVGTAVMVVAPVAHAHSTMWDHNGGMGALWAIWAVSWFVAVSWAARATFHVVALEERARVHNPRASEVPRSPNALAYLYVLPNWNAIWRVCTRPFCCCMAAAGCGADDDERCKMCTDCWGCICGFARLLR